MNKISWVGVIATITVAACATASGFAHAHAFLDHASPAVGGTVQRPPEKVNLWFTQRLEPAFSTIEIVDRSGHRVDGGDGTVDIGDATLLHVSLKPLPPGTYKVIWRVVSVDTHATSGDYTFRIEAK